MKRPLYLFIVLTTLAALLLSACGASDTNEPLVVLIETDEGPLTPLGYRTATGFWMTGWVYDTLYARPIVGYQRDPEPGWVCVDHHLAPGRQMARR